MGEDTAAVRIDAWLWAVRVYPSRTAATDACRAGHVKRNGTSVKPSQVLQIGDTVRARTPGGERVLVVRGLIARRVGAAIAVTQYEDQSPPPPPREERIAVRDRGAGRPTKRDRREIDRLRPRA